MIVFSHLTMGRILYSELIKNGYKLNYRRFLFGNVKPDICSMIRNQPHKIEHSFDFVSNEMFSLAGVDFSDSAKSFSYKLGIICHYLCDFFTYAHNIDFDGNFKEHMSYELKIHECSSAFISAIRSCGLYAHPILEYDFSDLEKRISQMHESYMMYSAPDPQRDFSFALSVCLSVCISLLNMCDNYSGISPAIAL